MAAPASAAIDQQHCDRQHHYEKYNVRYIELHGVVVLAPDPFLRSCEPKDYGISPQISTLGHSANVY